MIWSLKTAELIEVEETYLLQSQYGPMQNLKSRC